MNKTTTLEDWQAADASRLEALFKAKSTLNQTEFGARYGIGSQGMVWQYLSGRRPLNIKAAEAFARGLGVSIDEISPTIAQQVTQAATLVSGQLLSWPFDDIDPSKVRNLDAPSRAKLEAAVLLGAAQLGLDVRK